MFDILKTTMGKMTISLKKRYLATRYAFSFLGVNYKWGGETPNGMDCSGLVQEILKSVGLDPEGDQTADALFKHFKDFIVLDPNKRQAGCLAFFPVGNVRKTHVAYLISKYSIIEAGGGGGKTITSSDAERHKAFVRIRPLNYRGDKNFDVVDPFLSI